MLFLKEFITYALNYVMMLAAVYLMLRKKPKKKDFKRRLVISLVIGTAVQAAVSATIYIKLEPQWLFGIFKFLLSSLSLVCFCSLYEVKTSDFLFIILFAAAMQHWGTSIAHAATYGASLPFWAVRVVNAAFTLALFVPAYLLVISRFAAVNTLAQDAFVFLLLVFAYSSTEISMVVLVNTTQSAAVRIVTAVFDLVIGFAMFFAYVYMGICSRKRSDERISAALLENERKQYEALKRSTDGMRAQLHDLKYIVRSIRSGNASGIDIGSISNLTNALESSYNTGCAALDVILGDAKRMFDGKDIQFSCTAADVRADFMESCDLFSLLGNAFDNAAEYLVGLEREKRYATFAAKTVGKFLYMEVSNYYEGDGGVRIGMSTTKRDKLAHGYGTVNMKRVAEKYGGSLSIGVRDGELCVSATVPLPVGE